MPDDLSDIFFELECKLLLDHNQKLHDMWDEFSGKPRVKEYECPYCVVQIDVKDYPTLYEYSDKRRLCEKHKGQLLEFKYFQSRSWVGKILDAYNDSSPSNQVYFTVLSYNGGCIAPFGSKK